MVYRYTGIAAGAILVYALLALNGLLRGTVDGPPWQFVILAALALGGVLTWTGMSYRMRPWLIALLNLVAFVIVAFRIATPETMTFLFPTADSLDEMGRQLEQAMVIIRNGIEPVIPVSGLVVIVAAVFWAVGAVMAFGLSAGRPSFIIVPPLVLALQFATMDRSPTTMVRIGVFLVLLAAAILAAVTDERRSGMGRMAHTSGFAPTRSPIGRVTGTALGVTLIGAVLSVAALANNVPYDGFVDWRASTGLTGEYFGSVSYNPFTDIQSSLVTRSRVPLFYARVTGDVPADRVYFRMLTLETYAGGQFFADRPEVEPIENGRWEAPGQEFTGPTGTVTTEIVVDRLRMDWLPAAYSPVGVDGDDAFTGSVRVRQDDGSLRLDGGLTYPELAYVVRSEIPQPDLDVLSAGDDGGLSALFVAAAEDGERVPTPVLGLVRPEPPDVDRYLQLPEDLDPGIAAIAREKTRNLDTAFEAGLALESWFRSSDFRYTTDIPAGHGAGDLAEWLLEENSDEEFYRAGYCENFATSMAVLARTIGIPSRVVLGFTPGEQTTEDDIVVVRDHNAHAWVELWMPTQGWVRFDPTPRPDRVNASTAGDVTERLGFDPVAYFSEIPAPEFDPLAQRPFDIDPALIPDDNFGIDPSLLDDFAVDDGGFTLPGWLRPIVFGVVVIVVLIGLIPVVKLWRRRRRFARLRDGDIGAAWEEIVAQLTDFGERPDETLTPDELALNVDPVMRPLASVYARSVYGPDGDEDEGAVDTASRSLRQTSDRLHSRFSAPQRFAAWYRPASLIPDALRARLRRI